MVASEVRKLAERSQEAALEIGTLSIKTLEVSGRVGSLLEALAPSIARTAEMMEDTASMREQSAGADQIQSAVLELNHAVQRSTDSAQQARETSDGLSDSAGVLSSRMGTFRLPPMSAGAPEPGAESEGEAPSKPAAAA